MIYLPVIGYMLHVAVIQRALPIGMVAGLLSLASSSGPWSVLHAQVCFPLPTQSAWGKRLHFVVHGVHHDYPNDASRLVLPPSVSIPLAFIFYGLFLAIFGHLAPTPFAGLLSAISVTT